MIIKQTNIEQFKIREHGRYKGYTEGHAQWLEKLEAFCSNHGKTFEEQRHHVCGNKEEGGGKQ